MRALLLKSVVVAAFVIAPELASAQVPGGEHGPGAGAEHGPGTGGEHGPAGDHGGGAAPRAPGPAAGPAQRAPGAAGTEHMQPQPRATTAPAPEQGRPPIKADDGHMQRAGGTAPHRGGPPPHVSGDQRSRMAGAFHGTRPEHIPHADFAVRVGGIVPRHYHYYPLPPEIVAIVPEYEGYDYVEVGDEILILDPDTGEIVYVIQD